MSRTKRSDIMLSYAHKMRRQPTEAEKRLWRHLSGAGLDGHKFRRQAILGPYIADFYCPQKNLAVEIDGDTHVPEADATRDEALGKKGIKVVRVTNVDVLTNMDGVLRYLLMELDACADRWPHPNPSPEGEGL
ncbi:MAG TPA: endonuclease domain-containing protein [Sphingopyxis sp.]|nr:endonuclease domain-containing protein [Sphingopyxis sp.]HMP45191.1 endonuclease domain-containing protein [Sphingopyxis sp.]HMQ20154.1 endonuclease domain-containing protein [Sphingopyxis sp.]